MVPPPGLSMRFYASSDRLRRFVSGFFISDISDGARIEDLFLPISPTINFITPQSFWRLRIGASSERAIPAASIFGIATEPFRVSYGPCKSIFASLTLAGWAAICAGRADRYANRVTSAATVLRWDPSPILEMMDAQADDEEVVALLDGQLSSLIRPHERFGPFVDEVERRLDQGLSCTAEDLAAVTGMTPRNATRVFNSAIGLGARVLHRRRRFIIALWDIIQGVDISEVVGRHGYFDGSHLYKDAQEFLGMGVYDYIKGEVPFIEIMRTMPRGAQAVWPDAARRRLA